LPRADPWYAARLVGSIGAIERIGFVGIDLGSMAAGGKLAQFHGGPLPNQNPVKVG
jgi:hypothetical protein